MIDNKILIGETKMTPEEAEKLTVAQLAADFEYLTQELKVSNQFLYMLYHIAFDKGEIDLVLITEVIWEMYKKAEITRVRLHNTSGYLRKAAAPDSKFDFEPEVCYIDD